MELEVIGILIPPSEEEACTDRVQDRIMDFVNDQLSELCGIMASSMTVSLSTFEQTAGRKYSVHDADALDAVVFVRLENVAPITEYHAILNKKRPYSYLLRKDDKGKFELVNWEELNKPQEV